MTTGWIQQFIDALHALEAHGDAERITGQFAPDAALWNIAKSEPVRGREGIRQFWEQYRHQFGDIRSTFERIIADGDQAALEWSAEGTLRQSERPVAYRGVTLLKYGEAGLTEFAGYYDMRPFLESLGVGEAQVVGSET